jgi:hypothetical protein
MRKLTMGKLEQLERLAERALGDTGPIYRPLWLELPPVEGREWTGPRIFYLGDLPAEFAAFLDEFEDGLPGFPSSPELFEAIALLTGDRIEVTPEGLEQALLAP